MQSNLKVIKRYSFHKNHVSRDKYYFESINFFAKYCRTKTSLMMSRGCKAKICECK